VGSVTELELNHTQTQKQKNTKTQKHKNKKTQKEDGWDHLFSFD